MAKISTAMILAAGLGTRMRHLTSEHPKALVQVARQPLIQWTIASLIDANVNRIVINAHHCAEQLITYINDISHNYSGCEFIISDERGKLMDSGGGVRQALKLLASDEFVILNADSFWLANKTNSQGVIAQIEQAYDARRMSLLLGLARNGSGIGYHGAGDFDLPDRKTPNSTAQPHKLRIPTGDRAKNHVYSGVAIAKANLFSPYDEVPFSLSEIIRRQISSGHAYGLPLQGSWFHVGDPEAVASANTALANYGGGSHAN